MTENRYRLWTLGPMCLWSVVWAAIWGSDVYATLAGGALAIVVLCEVSVRRRRKRLAERAARRWWGDFEMAWLEIGWAYLLDHRIGRARA